MKTLRVCSRSSSRRWLQAHAKEYGALGQHLAYVPDGGTKAYEDKGDIIDALQTEILSRKLVSFSYESPA